MPQSDRIVAWFVGFCGLVAIGMLGWIVSIYGGLETYLDHAEPAAVVRAWRWLGGGDMFPNQQSLDFQRTAYGPVLHLLNAAMLALLGPSIQASKMAALSATILAPTILFLVCLRRFGLVPGLMAGMGLAAYQLAMGAAALWTRPDPFLILVLVLAVAAAPMDQSRTDLRPIRLVLLGILVGIAVNLKVHAFLYFLPLLGAYAPNRWFLTWPVMAVVSVLAFLAPFALPGIDLGTYLETLFSVAAGRPLDTGQLSNSIRFGALCLIPWVPWIIARLTGMRESVAGMLPGLLILSACLVVAIYPASAQGSSWTHFSPFMAIALHMTAHGVSVLGKVPWGRFVAVILVVLPLGLTGWVPAKRTLRQFDALGGYQLAADDLRTILAEYPNATIEMGYGSDNAVGYRYSFAMPLLVFNGQHQTLFAVSAMEDRARNLPPPEKILARLTRGETNIILIPDPEPAFVLNSFLKEQKAFWPEIGAAFKQGYFRGETIGRFHLWFSKNFREPSN